MSPYPPEETDQRLPEDLDAERAFLATLCDPAAQDCPELADCLRVVNGGEVFAKPQHAHVWRAFRALHARGEESNLIALKTECEAQGTLSRVGHLQGISDILSGEFVGRPLVLARRLTTLWRQRRTMLLAGQLLRAAPDEQAGILQELVDLGSGKDLMDPALIVANAAEWLDHEPPEQTWLVPGLVPSGVPCILAAQGGLGKSWLALQACICLATGKPFLGYEAAPPAGAIYLGLEDSRETFHRRVRAIVRAYREAGEWSHEDDAALRKHFKTSSINWRAKGASSHLPNLVEAIEKVMNELSDAGVLPGLLVIDTLARVSEGDENTVQALRPILNACTRLAEAGYTPLILHHVAKGQDGARAGKDKPALADRMATEWVRGSSSIVDNFRCILQLARIREDEAEAAGLDPDKARSGGYMVVGATKLNSGQRGEWTFLEQSEHGWWFVPQDGQETLARLRGKKALATLTKQMAVLTSLREATKYGAKPDLKAIARDHASIDAKDPDAWLRVTIQRLRRAGFIQKDGYLLTAAGLEKTCNVTRNNVTDLQDEHYQPFTGA